MNKFSQLKNNLFACWRQTNKQTIFTLNILNFLLFLPIEAFWDVGKVQKWQSSKFIVGAKFEFNKKFAIAIFSYLAFIQPGTKNQLLIQQS